MKCHVNNSFTSLRWLSITKVSNLIVSKRSDLGNYIYYNLRKTDLNHIRNYDSNTNKIKNLVSSDWIIFYIAFSKHAKITSENIGIYIQLFSEHVSYECLRFHKRNLTFFSFIHICFLFLFWASNKKLSKTHFF